MRLVVPRSLILVTAALLMLSACSDGADAVATPAPQETAIPSATPVPTRPTATRTPMPALTLVPAVTEGIPPRLIETCRGAPETQLIVGERGRVNDEDESPLNVRTGPSTEFRILGRLEVRTLFTVIDGPVCGGVYTWYEVESNGLSGWIAEGDTQQYYAEPYFPG